MTYLYLITLARRKEEESSLTMVFGYDTKSMSNKRKKSTSRILSNYRGSFFKDFIYLFMRDTEREAETEAEGEAGSMQGAQCGTQP